MKDTKKPPAKSTPVAEDAPSVLAFHIAAILNHPDTPARIYNALVDEISSLDAPGDFFDSKEYVETVLRVALARHKKGGE